MAIHSLPVEVLAAVFTEAANAILLDPDLPPLNWNGRNSFLRSMCLVCRGWSGAAQEVLWREVRLVGIDGSRKFCEELPAGRATRTMGLCGMDEAAAERALASSRGLRRLAVLSGVFPVEMLSSASNMPCACAGLGDCRDVD